MTSVLTVVALGFFLGMRHATDPDHVVAVSTIVSRYRSMKGAVLVGAVWGVGHTVTVLVVGGGIILFGWVIPPRLGLSLELSVALMLIVLGVLNLVPLLKRFRDAAPLTVKPSVDHGHVHLVHETHSHAHPHGDYVHTHPHEHDPERHPHDPARTPLGWVDRRLGFLRGYQLVRPLVVGVVHGLAGSAAVALLVLAAIPTPTWAVLYLAVFGLGTVAGMMLVTAAVGIPFTFAGRTTSLQSGIRLASGAVSLCVGILIAWQVGVIDGLFTGATGWTPK